MIDSHSLTIQGSSRLAPNCMLKNVSPILWKLTGRNDHSLRWSEDISCLMYNPNSMEEDGWDFCRGSQLRKAVSSLAPFPPPVPASPLNLLQPVNTPAWLGPQLIHISCLSEGRKTKSLTTALVVGWH